MLYVNEKAAVGTKSISLTTPEWLGYQEAGVSKNKLQDCATKPFKVLANDDLHGHITN